MSHSALGLVTPAQAGLQVLRCAMSRWIPACAGVTEAKQRFALRRERLGL
jgi:hypothetical protein